MSISNQKTKELSNCFKAYLMIMGTLFALSLVINILENFNHLFIGPTIGSFIISIACIWGLLLMYRAQNGGFYIYIGTMIIAGLSFVFVYGHLEGYHMHFLGNHYSKEASVLLTICGYVFHILLLLLCMSVKKNGKNAFHVLWNK